MMVGGLSGERTDTRTAAAGPLDSIETGFSLPPRWKVARLLGRGGQAEVWLAHDGELDEWVAVKVFHRDLSDAARERLRREVRLGRTLHHPHLVRIHELIEAGDRLAVIMEYLPGGSLADSLSTGPLAVADVVRLADQALSALEFLHRNGVVHRDVKPSNLLLDGGGTLKLGDFGLVRRIEGDADLTRTAMAVGTPVYMSPEQIRGVRAGFPADLYGLGVTLFELLAGRAPFLGSSQLAVASQHLQQPAPDLGALRRDCPRWLARFVARLLEKRPQDRWADATAARHALARRRFLASPRVLRRAAAGALVLAALAAGTSWSLRSLRPEPASVVVGSDFVAAVDRRGEEIWRRSLPAPGPAVIGRFLSVGSRDLAVVTRPDPAGTLPGVKDIVVFDESGRENVRFPSIPASLPAYFPDFTPRLVTPTLVAIGADPQRRQRLAWLSNHVTWYPSLLGLWRSGDDPGRLGVLLNSGTLLQVRAADLDGDGTEELILLGLNNPIGFQSVLIILEAPSASFYGQTSGVSPDLVTQWVELVANHDRAVRAYVPFQRVAMNLGRVSVEGGRIEIRQPDGRVAFDRDGNPEGSPVFGHGPEPRQAAWDEITSLCREIEGGAALEHGRIQGVLSRHAEVFSEPPMHLAAELLIARSLALAGRHEEAIVRLRAEAASQPRERDPRMRLAEQLVMAGRPSEAAETLEALLATREPGRGYLDPVVTLALLGALEDDAALFRRAVATWREFSPDAGGEAFERGLEAVFAFCRGDFEAPALGQGRRVSDLLPAADVVRAWASLATGRVAPADTAAAAVVLAASPEIRWPATALEALARLRMGEVRKADALAASAVLGLERPARVSVEARLWLAVASRVAADALAAQGKGRLAEVEAERARGIAPQCWFGRRQ